MEVATDDSNKKVETCCRHVERHLRLAISDWYHLGRHDGVDYPKSMNELRDSLKTLIQEVRNAGMEV